MSNSESDSDVFVFRPNESYSSSSRSNDRRTNEAESIANKLPTERGNYKPLLNYVVRMRNLIQPAYQTDSMSKEGQIGYISKVYIGDKVYTMANSESMPYQTKADAERAVAKLAYTDLKRFVTRTASDQLVHDNSPNWDLINNVYKVFKAKGESKIGSQVIEQYLIQNKVKHDSDWMKKVKSSGKFEVEIIDSPITGKHHFIKLNPNVFPEETFDIQEFSHLKVQNLPEELTLKSESNMEVQLLNVTNTGKLLLRKSDPAFRLVIYDDFVKELEDYYLTNRRFSNVWNPIIGYTYVFANESSKCAFRVIVKNVNDDGAFCCYSVDDGVEFIVRVNELYELADQFQNYPFQAFEASIYGIAYEAMSPKKADSIRQYFEYKSFELDCTLGLNLNVTKKWTQDIVVELLSISKEYENLDCDLNQRLLNFTKNS